MQSKAIILLSGGLDSATTLAIANTENEKCYALSFAYGQRHHSELDAAKKIAHHIGVAEHRIFTLDLASISNSSLTDKDADVLSQTKGAIPSTYVPARNTIFLSIAMAWAEILQCSSIYIGVNVVDYSGYPDCRPEFIEAFQQMMNVATRASSEGHYCRIVAPLIDMTKSQIIQRGISLGVDYGVTVSCYQADEQGRACGQCEACQFRKQGFFDAKQTDPTHYIAS